MPQLKTLILCLMVLSLASAATAAAELFPGIRPLPIDSRGCLPLDDQRWFTSTDANSLSAYPFEGHGQACLYELRFAEALPKLQRAAHLNPSTCTLVALGVAYDGLSRRPEAAESWRHASHIVSKDVPFVLGLELPLLHGDNTLAMRILKDRMEPRYHADGSYQTVTGPDKDVAKQFDTALLRAVAGYPDQGARMITSLYKQDSLNADGASDIRAP